MRASGPLLVDLIFCYYRRSFACLCVRVNVLLRSVWFVPRPGVQRLGWRQRRAAGCWGRVVVAGGLLDQVPQLSRERAVLALGQCAYFLVEVARDAEENRDFVLYGFHVLSE